MTKSNPSSIFENALHVAVGVIKNTNGEILIAQRPLSVHQGGLWEFPGGKVETGESVIEALRRELQEELAIHVEHCEPLIKIRHDYPDLSVLLDVWTVDKFSGTAHGKEGQAVRWVKISELSHYDFPAANLPIVHAAQLPCFYAVLDDAEPSLLRENLQKILGKGIKLIQARLKNLPALAAENFIREALTLCEAQQAQLLINSAVKNAEAFQHLPVGLHLTSHDLMHLTERPTVKGWLAASCHNLIELRHAEKIGVDFAVLAPVLNTPTHPDTPALGWETFADCVAQVNLPVYALGGVTCDDKNTVKALGGHGIAGIRAFLV
jgi:8-oxo-dGTP diphosphatase